MEGSDVARSQTTEHVLPGHENKHFKKYVYKCKKYDKSLTSTQLITTQYTLRAQHRQKRGRRGGREVAVRCSNVPRVRQWQLSDLTRHVLSLWLAAAMETGEAS